MCARLLWRLRELIWNRPSMIPEAEAELPQEVSTAFSIGRRSAREATTSS
jgi:hypothetical protein